MAEDAAFTASIFPPPPGEWGLFTSNNLDLQSRLEASPSHEWDQLSPAERVRRQEALLQGARVDGYATQPLPGTTAEDAKPAEALDSNPDQIDVLLSLSAPRVDWIVSEGRYSCFGAIWPIEENLPPLSVLASAPASGVSQLYPPALPPTEPDGNPRLLDKRQAMISLLRSLLLAHYQLVGILSAPPREYVATQEVPSLPGMPPSAPMMTWRNEAMDVSAFVRNVAVNLQHLINEMRAPQAQVDAELYLKAQLERRRAQTRHIRHTCTSIRASIESMRTMLVETKRDPFEQVSDEPTDGRHATPDPTMQQPPEAMQLEPGLDQPN